MINKIKGFISTALVLLVCALETIGMEVPTDKNEAACLGAIVAFERELKDAEKTFEDLRSKMKFEKEHTLHRLAYYFDGFRDISAPVFKYFAAELVEKHKDNFSVKWRGYSPLAELMALGRPIIDKSLTDEEVECARFLFHLYIDKEPFIPSCFKGLDFSPFHVFLGTLGSGRYLNYPLLSDVMDYISERVKALKGPINLYDDTENNHFLKYAYLVYCFLKQEDVFLRLLPEHHLPSFELADKISELKQDLDISYAQLQESLFIDGWRLGMDFNKQRAGETWIDYERTEQGTIPSLLDGFGFIVKTKGKNIDSNYIYQLHRIATAHRDKNISHERGLGFGLSIDNSSLPFLEDFTRRYGSIVALEIYPVTGGETGIQIRSNIHMLPIENIKSCIQSFIDKYYQEISKEKVTFSESIIASIELCHDLVILHPFRDGNTRTFITLLLNKLLMDKGLPFCVFENPNSLDGRTSIESVPLVIEGICNFHAIRTGKLPEGMKTTRELLDELNLKDIKEWFNY